MQGLWFVRVCPGLMRGWCAHERLCSPLPARVGTRPAVGLPGPVTMSPGSPVARRWLGSADLTLTASLGALLLWMVLAAGRGELDSPASDRFWVGALLFGAGVAAGRPCVRRGVGPLIAAATAVLVLATVVTAPIYSNAEAAVGVQLVALSGLLLSGLSRAPVGARVDRSRVVIAGTIGTLGVLLTARAQTASLLVLLVVAIIALSLSGHGPTSRRRVLGVGLGITAAAVLVVLVLGAHPAWPAWLRHSESLSYARQKLWGDALALWREHPVLGGGPGSFYEYSEIARSADHLYAAHSSILQVGAEFGAIGALLFLVVLVSGAHVATQGDPIRGLIGVTAWCALAVHSMIDHLYEFPLVCLLAGLVIGWAGSRVRAGGAGCPGESVERPAT